MFNRLLDLDPNTTSSAFLFGPRGTGKTFWIKTHLQDIIYIDLLASENYNQLLAAPGRLKNRIPPKCKQWVVIDEVQRIPELLNEVHRLIEHEQYRFLLTGSSARSLRRAGTNLLAGRALTYHMHPLTAQELGNAFSLEHALQFGLLPKSCLEQNPQHYLESYVSTYLREEIVEEGITRKLGEFVRFLEIASFSQGSTLNLSEIAREASIERRTVSNYFVLLEDLLIARQIPAFTKRAKRRLVQHPKFYFFDTGIFRVIRPKGPLDRPEEIDGPALETLVLQQILAINDYYRLGYEIFYWRTANDLEVDFVLYGERGIHAIEVKRKKQITTKDLIGLKAFLKDYPSSKAYLFYGGSENLYFDDIQVIPFLSALPSLYHLF